ncbi:HNH endonuclease [Anaerovoracaceae bacterium 41-7]
MELEKKFNYNGLSYIATSDGKIKSGTTGKFLKTRINRDGYEEVTLGKSEKRNPSVRVHRIIAKLFVDNPDKEHKIEVNHKDFNRLNNDYTNLEWVTHKENIEYSYIHGRHDGRCVGEKNVKARLCEDDVKKIRKLVNSNIRTSEIAKLYNVGWSTIYNIKIGNTWKGVE